MINDEIGKIIYKQMRHIDPNLLMCIGFSRPVILPEGLAFKVNGYLHKGDVHITLNYKDLYDIELIKTKRKQCQKSKAIGVKKFNTSKETVLKINDIYLDNLMSTLERYIENEQAI